MGKSKHLASLLSAAGLIGSEDMESDAIPPSGATTYATIDDLPLTGLTSGALAYVSSTDTFYIANGNGWYKVTTVNTAPSIDSLAANVTLIGSNLPTTNTVTTTATGSDPEGIPVDISYTLEPDASTLSFVSSATTVGDDFVVSFIDDGAQTPGSANVVVSASDGVNITTAKRNLELLFAIQATGGDTTYTATVGGTSYKFHEFLANGSFVSTAGGVADILLVGGGGGGGSYTGGGGGGGEVILAQNVEIGTGTFTVTIGRGGRGRYSGFAVSNGGTTSLAGSGFTTITAKGGAYGGTEGENAAVSQGNGGGGAFQNSSYSTSSSTVIADGTHGSSSTYTMYSGNRGGAGGSVKGGGGAGADANGTDGSSAGTNTGSAGGAGVQILNFDQYSYYYSGGGGGGTYNHPDIGGHGGVGGGGGGGGGWSGGGGISGGTGGSGARNTAGSGGYDYNTATGGDGATNSGGGGGGAGYANPAGGDGGTGILIIRYQV